MKAYLQTGLAVFALIQTGLALADARQPAGAWECTTAMSPPWDDPRDAAVARQIQAGTIIASFDPVTGKAWCVDANRRPPAPARQAPAPSRGQPHDLPSFTSQDDGERQRFIKFKTDCVRDQSGHQQRPIWNQRWNLAMNCHAVALEAMGVISAPAGRQGDSDNRTMESRSENTSGTHAAVSIVQLPTLGNQCVVAERFTPKVKDGMDLIDLTLRNTCKTMQSVVLSIGYADEPTPPSFYRVFGAPDKPYYDPMVDLGVATLLPNVAYSELIYHDYKLVPAPPPGSTRQYGMMLAPGQRFMSTWRNGYLPHKRQVVHRLFACDYVIGKGLGYMFWVEGTNTYTCSEHVVINQRR